MKIFIKFLLLLWLLVFDLHASFVGDAFKETAKAGAVYGVTKALKSDAGKAAVKSVKEKLHKNSKEYEGESHVYRIKNKDGTYKIGESSQGKDKFGNSKRAESQVAKLKRETGDSSYQSEVRKDFSSKKDARNYETRVIERMRSFYGKNKNDKSVLVGNKNNR